jgi:hypothetical protein
MVYRWANYYMAKPIAVSVHTRNKGLYNYIISLTYQLACDWDPRTRVKHFFLYFVFITIIVNCTLTNRRHFVSRYCSIMVRVCYGAGGVPRFLGSVPVRLYVNACKVIKLARKHVRIDTVHCCWVLTKDGMHGAMYITRTKWKPRVLLLE